MWRPSKAAGGRQGRLGPKGGPPSATGSPCCREEWLVLLRAIYGPRYAARLPPLLGKRLEFVAGEAPRRPRAAHLESLAAWLAAPGPGGAPRVAALGYLSVTLPGAADVDAVANGDDWPPPLLPPERPAALCGLLEAVQGGQRLVFLELHSTEDDGQGTALAGELLLLPALRELVLDTYGASVTGSLAQLGCLTRLTVRSARLEAALPTGLRQLEVLRSPWFHAGLGGVPQCIPGGLPRLERLVVKRSKWYNHGAERDPLDITALSEMRMLTHLELDGLHGTYNCFELRASVPLAHPLSALSALRGLRRLRLASVIAGGECSLRLTDMPGLEASLPSRFIAYPYILHARQSKRRVVPHAGGGD